MRKIMIGLSIGLFLNSSAIAENNSSDINDLIAKVSGEKCEPNAMDQLFKRHPKEECLMDAARRLGNMGEVAKPAVPTLIQSLKTYRNVETGDEILPVRSSIALALGKINDETAVLPLLEVLQSDDKVVIAQSASLLANYQPIQNSSYSAVIEALGILGPKAKEALPVLESYLKAFQEKSITANNFSGLETSLKNAIQKIRENN